MHYTAGEIKCANPDRAKMCGDGCIEELGAAPASPSLRAAHVKFVAGALTKWHYHTGEQLLLATDGNGFVELQGQPIAELREGDRVFTPTGVWHRHGAAEGETFGLAVTGGETKWDDQDSCQRDSRDAARLGTSIVTEFTELNQRLLKYEEAGASEALAPLLSEAFIIVRSSGEKADRQALLNAVPANANPRPQHHTVQRASHGRWRVAYLHRDDHTKPGRHGESRPFLEHASVCSGERAVALHHVASDEDPGDWGLSTPCRCDKT